MTNLTVTHGARTWKTGINNLDGLLGEIKREIVRDFHASFNKTVNTVMAWVKSRIEPTIAKRTGLMRTAFINAFDKNLRFVSGNDVFEMEFEFNYAKFISDIKYAKYHVTQDPSYRYYGGYTDPSTYGTKPLSLAFLRYVERLLFRELDYNLKLWGLLPE